MDVFDGVWYVFVALLRHECDVIHKCDVIIVCWMVWYGVGCCYVYTTHAVLQMNGEWLNRKPLSDFVVCTGMGSCPLAVKHPPTGTEFSLGCGVCRREASGY